MGDSDELSLEPGQGMKMTLFGIRKKFPSVKTITTATLSTWMRSLAGTAHDQTSNKERLVILVGKDLIIYHFFFFFQFENQLVFFISFYVGTFPQVTLSQTTNFRFFQNERVCRWQF